MASNHTVERKSKLSFGPGFKIRFGVFIKCHGEQVLALEELNNIDYYYYYYYYHHHCYLCKASERNIYFIVLCERGKAASMLLMSYLVDDGPVYSVL